MKECLNYKKISSAILECFNCFHFCRIKEGETGICGVRQNLAGKLYSLVYGQAAAVNVDPVEKKPLFHWLPGSSAYSFGTLGCNFRCANCQNFDIAQIFGLKGKIKEYQEIAWGYELAPGKIIAEALKNKCQSIAYTYNEPTVFLEYALDTMKLARQKNLKNIWVSNGYMSKETLELILPYLDAVNIDIKSFDDKFYQSNCGARLAPVLANCQRLVKEKVWLEITTLVIPTLADDAKMLKKLAKFIKEKLGDFVPWHLSAFSGRISWKLQQLPATPIETIKKVYLIGKEAGLKYVYAGNLWERNLESTFCPRCGEMLIERIGYQIARHDKNGSCFSCGKKIEGFFNNR
ncbi:AmmeMemoRadiSam system radical SAM enzyme [Patescibacteria group bacterium]|nr:AmmeMemoRadiSam system radical SAM enzyme [Patescibacteria group bacterium]